MSVAVPRNFATATSLFSAICPLLIENLIKANAPAKMSPAKTVVISGLLLIYIQNICNNAILFFYPSHN